MKMNDMIPSWLRGSSAPSHPTEMTFSAPVEVTITAAKEGQPAVAPRFSMVAYNGGLLRLEGWRFPVVAELAGVEVPARGVKMLKDHDPKQIVGHSDKHDLNGRIFLEGTISGTGEAAREIVANAKNGFPWEASIGAPVKRVEFVAEGKSVFVNGREFTGPLYVARASVLKETSFLAFGADEGTEVNIAAKEDSNMNPFDQWLKAKGIDASKLDDATKTTLKAAFDAEQKPQGDNKPKVEASATATPPADPVAELRAKYAAETARVSQIHTICASGNPQIEIEENGAKVKVSLEAHAIEKGWDVTKVELESLRATRPQAPNVNTLSVPMATGAVIEAALCVAGGLSNIEKAFDAKTLEAQHSLFKGRLGLQRLLLEAAWQGGYSGRHFELNRDMLRAAFSTISLPGILSNTMNKFLLQGFNGVEQAWRAVSAVKSVNDFKQITSYRLTGAMQFEEVGSGGELKHGTLGEESFTNQARTYGIMHAITRTNIINDDLSALSEVPMKIGRGGALKLNSVFWTAFLADHNTFFPTNDSKKNYISGAGTVPSIAGLSTAIAKFRRQLDPDGKPLGVEPAIIVAPPEQEAQWAEINRSTTVNTGGAATAAQVPSVNIYSGRFPSAISAYLTSALEWYLIANPVDLAMIETVFLNGVQQPTIESADADFNTLGIQTRGFWDFGVAKQDYRAAVKSKGAA